MIFTTKVIRGGKIAYHAANFDVSANGSALCTLEPDFAVLRTRKFACKELGVAAEADALSCTTKASRPLNVGSHHEADQAAAWDKIVDWSVPIRRDVITAWDQRIRHFFYLFVENRVDGKNDSKISLVLKPFFRSPLRWMRK